jgi:hypothetical protein
VGLGGFEIALAPYDTFAGKLLALYGMFTGSAVEHGYFPDVPPNYRAVFILKDKAGRTWEDVLETGSSREGDLRLAQIGAEILDEDYGEEYASSWARRMFERHPNAVEVEIQVEYYEMPDMAEYRQGARPQWTWVSEKDNEKLPFYRTFTRGKVVNDSSDEE